MAIPAARARAAICINKEAGKVKEAIDLHRHLCRRRSRFHPSAAQKDLRVLIGCRARWALCWAVLGQPLAYAAGLVGGRRTISCHRYGDEELGYNWKWPL
jgi:hypothetical protein